MIYLLSPRDFFRWDAKSFLSLSYGLFLTFLAKMEVILFFVKGFVKLFRSLNCCMAGKTAFE